MKKIIKLLLVFFIGVFLGYYVNETYKIKDMFTNKYKAFQIGVYTDIDAANTFSKLMKDSIIIKDNELYRVYAAILKNDNNIDNMSKYLNKNNIDYYLKDIEINDKEIVSIIKDYENIMNNNSEVVFLEMNKMIMEKYKESL